MQRVEFVPHYRCYNERCIGNRAGLHAKIAEPPPILCKDTNKPRAKANLFAFCRGEVSKKKSKIITRRAENQTQLLFSAPPRNEARRGAFSFRSSVLAGASPPRRG